MKELSDEFIEVCSSFIVDKLPDSLSHLADCKAFRRVIAYQYHIDQQNYMQQYWILLDTLNCLIDLPKCVENNDQNASIDKSVPDLLLKKKEMRSEVERYEEGVYHLRQAASCFGLPEKHFIVGKWQPIPIGESSDLDEHSDYHKYPPRLYGELDKEYKSRLHPELRMQDTDNMNLLYLMKLARIKGPTSNKSKMKGIAIRMLNEPIPDSMPRRNSTISNLLVCIGIECSRQDVGSILDQDKRQNKYP